MNINDRVKLTTKVTARPAGLLSKGSLGTVTAIVADDDHGLLVEVRFDKLPSRPQELFATRPAWSSPMLVVVQP